MNTRIISGLILIPIILFFIIYGGIPLKIAVIILSLIGMKEFFNALDKESSTAHYIGYFFAVVYMVFAEFIINENNMFNIFASVFMVTILFSIVMFHNSVSIKSAIITFFGYFYVCFLLSHIYLIREYNYGKFFIWLVFICAFGCDTGAYFTGMLFGKHKLIPSLSPKKTVEGAIGGVVVATLIAVLYGFCIERYFTLENVNTILICAITGVLGSILSQIGDLSASAIKRYTGIKDFGNLIPGHGGILDRFDSVLFTAPIVYYIMLFTIEVI